MNKGMVRFLHLAALAVQHSPAQERTGLHPRREGESSVAPISLPGKQYLRRIAAI
jgi:hypothetical protein